MTCNEGKDTATQLEKRHHASKDVDIKFTDGLFENFAIIKNENVAYIGTITTDKQGDNCTCPSFNYGQRYDEVNEDIIKGESRYEAENGHPFQCKHIIKAHSLREDEI